MERGYLPELSTFSECALVQKRRIKPIKQAFRKHRVSNSSDPNHFGHKIHIESQKFLIRDTKRCVNIEYNIERLME